MKANRGWLLAVWCVGNLGAQAPGGVSYFRDIRPIIQRNCQSCHQPAMKSGGLDLTRYESFAAGGSKGAPFNAAQPQQSLVIAYLQGTRQPRMPLGSPPLPDDQIELVRGWIAAGAKDDTPPEARDTAALGQPPTYHLPPVITALEYSPDGSLLAVSGYREVLLHKADGTGLAARLVGLSDRIQSLQFSRDGKTLMAAGGTPARFGEVQLWDVESRKLRHSVTLTNETVFGASFSPDGKRVAVGCADNTVRVIDVDAGREVLKISNHENWVLGTAFGVDGKRLVSVGRDQAAKLTDAATGSFIENINAMRGELAGIARHPTRDVILIGGGERIPYLYMMDRPASMIIADDSTLIRKFEIQDGAIFALAFSPDGSRIAVAGASETVPVYQTETGERAAACKGSKGTYAIAFSPDGERLASGGFDGKVRIYEVKSGKLDRDFVPVPVETRIATVR
ncbi:MAG TPA: c-type cytochrome domain-containing protein [Bryobacteraceae bacterium]|nr:c-type cytochrome domain-containing protein [Bryobacteraceae bacterium]